MMTVLQCREPFIIVIATVDHCPCNLVEKPCGDAGLIEFELRLAPVTDARVS